ncbi:hypothetical protein [Persicobacter psychrovividus]|uniref:Uncharacterized protein n=1 Tax=Persicobacter psychrovividus TaxID=387638 RepID=A0ABM7VD37_9BACT|nr:hypothetical protein PEPS_11380 [Persicobacter psychrovividus]
MRLIKRNENIGLIRKADNSIYAKKINGGLCKIIDNECVTVIQEEIDSFRVYDGKLVYKLFNHRSKLFSIEGDIITEIMSDDDKVSNISSGVLFESKLQIYYYINNDFLPSGMYLLGSDLELERSENISVYSTKIDQHYFNKSNKFVYSFNRHHEERYKIDISDYGRVIIRHRNTGEVLSDEPNEIDGELFRYQGLLYVPLKGGQLLALNASDGKKSWIWEHDRLGAYGIVGDKIYKQDGKEVFEIDANNGGLLKSKKFSDDALLVDFHATGPIWVYPDVIIVVDVLSGKICMLDRLSLKVIEFFTINKKLPFSNNAIVWNAGKLHILDLENTLHIFDQFQN